MSNTRIEFLYRDASNYKAYNSVVVSGTFTDEQINQIIDSLEDGMYFIPEQIGFPVERFGSITEDDHCWCELTAFDFETTDDEPTLKMSANEVLKAFLAAKLAAFSPCAAGTEPAFPAYSGISPWPVKYPTVSVFAIRLFNAAERFSSSASSPDTP